MLHEILTYASWFFLFGGGFFCIVGGLGMHRFPDFYTRIHASGVTDTMGAGMVLVGLMLQEGTLPNTSWLNVGRLILILLFLYLSSATSTHALAKAAFNHGPKPLLSRKEKNHNRPH